MPSVPIVQIVHYSDIHLRSTAAIHILERLARFNRRLYQNWRQGLAGADSRALAAFERFLQRRLSADPRWQDVPVWLVDTGDGTTFGEDAALDRWLHVWSKRFKAAAGPNAESLILYGNHDAWPGDHPLFNRSRMGAHRDHLRRHRFADIWPTPPLRAAIPAPAAGEVQLYALNSVDHDWLAAVRANGWVAPDRHWQSPAPMLGPSAADDLARLAGGSVTGAKDLRIAAMHYPVAHAAAGGGWRLREVLANRVPFAGDLMSARHVGPPVAHLLLAGHTHAPHPPLGGVPPALGLQPDTPLARGQGQFVTASLAQNLLEGAPAPQGGDHNAQMLHDFPHQASVIRLEVEPTAPATILISRAIAGRREGGEFDYLEIAPGSLQHWEQTRLQL